MTKYQFPFGSQQNARTNIDAMLRAELVERFQLKICVQPNFRITSHNDALTNDSIRSLIHAAGPIDLQLSVST